MSALVITPDFDSKTAKIEGIAAAGEKVSVTLKNCASKNRTTLRLRVLFCGRTLAQFPLSSQTQGFAVSGDDLTCTLALNTTQMLKVMRRIPEMELGFALDDPSSSVQQLYFVGGHEIKGWPQEIGTDTPIDLNNYRTDIETLNNSISSLAYQLANEIQRVFNAMARKVDKVDGKGLSTLDFTTAILSSLATKKELSAHTNNPTIHVTQEERTNWNAGLAQISSKQDIIVKDGYAYVPIGIIAGTYNWKRLQAQFDEDMGWTMTLSDKTYIRSNDGTDFLEGI